MVRTLAAIRSDRMGLGAAAVMALLIGAALLGPNHAAAGGGCRGEVSTSASGTRVAMRETCFVPTVLHARVGDTVTWENESDLPHAVAGATLEWGNYNEFTRGQAVSYPFAKAGVYPYYCFTHNGMVGAIVVEAAGAQAAATVSAAAAVPTPAAPQAGTGVNANGPGWPGARNVVLVAGVTGVVVGLLAYRWRRRGA